jgi:MGT family glycosyltransferase
MGKHIAFVSIPAFGHVNPTLPLVTELVRRGHRVSYATGERFIPIVEAAGATGFPLPLSGMPAKPPSGQDFTIEALVPMMDGFLAEVRAAFPPLVEHFMADRPAAVCYDMTTFPGRMLADKLGVLDVSLISFLASNEKFGLQDLMKNASFSMDNPILLRYVQQIGEFAAEHGLSTIPEVYGGTPASLNLVFLTKEVQIAADAFDDRYFFLGPQLGSRLDTEQWTPPPASSPVLLISLGTIWNDNIEFFRTCVESFADTRWHVVLIAGERTDLASIGPVPGNFEILPFAPQLGVLRHADVFVTHAGMGAVMEALYFGVPMVGVPQIPEQETNIRRVEELGLGLALGLPPVTAKSLRDAVEEVAADLDIRTEASRISKTVQAGEGTTIGADAIEARLP